MGKLKQNTDWLRVRDLRLDAPYQRRMDQDRAQHIADEYDSNSFMVPVVSRRQDGSLWVMDGQHRITALRLMGWDDQMVLCEVREGLTYEEEARLHVRLNRDRKKPTAMSEFNALLEAKDPMCLQVATICSDRGLSITQERGDGGVSAVGALLTIYRRGGKNILEKTLDAITAAWGTSSDGYAADILKAVAQAVNLCPDMVEERFVKALNKLRPHEYVRRGIAGRDATKAHLINNITSAMLAEYNQIPGKKVKVPTERLLTPRAPTMFVSHSGRHLTRDKGHKTPTAAAAKK